MSQPRASNPSAADVAAEIGAAAAGAQEAPDMTGGLDDRGDPGEAFDVKEMPPDGPVIPLGFKGQKFYFLDFAQQLIELGSEFRKGELLALYGTRMGHLDATWPAWKQIEKKRGEQPVLERDGFNQKHAQQSHIMACSKKGYFDRRNKERGRGAHLGEHGELVFHCGNQVIVGGRKGVRDRALSSTAFKPGYVLGFVYPTLEKLAPPTDDPATAAVGKAILECLKTWNWNKPVAAYLLLCWIAAGLLGGALRVRPHGWIVGPSGAGKTTLQKFLQELMGDWGVFTEDATEAGVRQLLDQDTLAVMFDEIEAEEDNREITARIVRLARLAYSGATSLRGSSDHQAKQFVARSCFLFSSIHHQELPVQDRNRIAVLQLSKFPPRTPKFLVPAQARDWGDQLRRRLIEQWPRFDATIALYQHEMNTQGYTGREQDTYGTLLACGDLLLHDEAPDALSLGAEADRVAKLVGSLAVMIDAARSEAEDTTERCIKRLASHRLSAKGGETPQTIARWLQQLIIRIHNRGDLTAVRERLAAQGLRVVHLKPDHLDGNGQGGIVEAFVLENSSGVRTPMWLAVAHPTNTGAKDIFTGSMWGGGIWPQSLNLAEYQPEGGGDPRRSYTKKARFGGGPSENCTLVPLDLVVDIEDAIREAAALQSGP